MKVIFLSSFLILLVGCKSAMSDTNAICESGLAVKIPDNLHSEEQFVLSTIADSISYAILETSNDCLISEMNEVQVAEDELFIRANKNELFCFSNSGEFLNKIGKRGKGLYEYYSLIDFAVNDKLVYILDYSKRIALYTHKGEFKGYIKTTKQASRIMSFPNSKLACYVPDSQFRPEDDIYSWLIIDDSGAILAYLTTPRLRYNNSGKRYLSNHFVLLNFSSYHSYAFKEAFNDSLYYIKPSSLKMESYGYIDEGIHKINYKSTFEQVAYAKHNMRINNLIDIPGYMFISYKFMCKSNVETRQAIYDKTNHKFFNITNNNGEENTVYDVNTGLSIHFLSCLDHDQIVGYIDAYTAAATHMPLPFGNTINDMDNPIIVFINLKKT